MSTLDKALKINLDPLHYGSFAEIGAGQETANWFFRASGTAGTVAETTSAYDMTMSDALYGPVERYVSEERLRSMMEKEFYELQSRLDKERGDHTCFFAFCNTVKAKGYRDNGYWHGWLGMQFQLKPKSPPSRVILHVRLNDPDHESQMKALGILGTNLIYAIAYKLDDMKLFVESLIENIHEGHLEIDLLQLEGHGFQMVDNRLFALQLVESKLTKATMFLPNGQVRPAADIIYKKPIILLRGSFAPVTKLNMEMMAATRQKFTQFLDEDKKQNCLELCEITINNLLRGGCTDHLGFLDRANALQALGMTVLITRFARFHSVSDLLSRFTSEPIAISLSIGLLNELFKEKWYTDLPGGLLESFGRLFRNRTQLYVYPWKNRKSGELVTAENFNAPENLRHLYAHLYENELIHPVHVIHEDLLKYTGRDITRMIHQGDERWKDYVPEEAYKSALHL